MRTLDVWLFNQLIGHLVEGHKGARFIYEGALVEKNSGKPLLSLSLPVKKRSFGESKTENWFTGLLPEGERRVRLCHKLAISPHDWIGLLGEIGWECAGAVRVFPQEKKHSNNPGYKEIPLKKLLNELSYIQGKQINSNEDIFRMSLGGFQDKLCIAMPHFVQEDSRVSTLKAYLPTGDAPSTHILKPEPLAYPGLAEAEAWAMTVASVITKCSKVSLLCVEDYPQTLIIERYDRIYSKWPDKVKRLHQEDCCQALGIHSLNKYASSKPKGNDPSYKAIANLLIRHAENPTNELNRLLRQMTVNFILGNWDAHAKNTSFLYQKPAVPTLSPLYDVIPISNIEPRTTLMSLRINGILDPENITREDFLIESTSWGIKKEQAEETLQTCLDKFEDGLTLAEKRYPKAAKLYTPDTINRLRKLGGQVS